MRSLIVLLFLGMALAGCGSKGTSNGIDANTEAAGTVGVSADTGGIRGIVLTPGIVPVPNVKVSIPNGPSSTSDKNGAFTFSNLKPGDYFLTASKVGYTTVQQAATVKAGDPNPPVVKVMIDRLPGAQPYYEPLRFDGFYECGFSAGQPGRPFITDQCDMAVRTAYDFANDTVGPPPTPRNVEKNTNTMFVDVGNDVQTVIQEAFWTDSQVPTMMVLLSSTPIDNGCDCSDKDYLDITMPSPTYGRLDNATAVQGQHVAVRGFFDWESVSTAQNFGFTIITTLFHNYSPPEGWTFETRDQYPIE